MKNVLIWGTGSWGSSLAVTLSKRNNIGLYSALASDREAIKKDGENKRYLPGYSLKEMTVFDSLEEGLKWAEYIVMAVPSQYLKQEALKVKDFNTENHLFVSVVKGLEQGTFRRMSQVIEDSVGNSRGVVVLSGPSHAEEVVEGQPTLLTAAHKDVKLSQEVQAFVHTERLRVYTNTDVVGVEIGAAIKNIIAIAAGAIYGLGFGANTLSALVTRGLVEIARFGVSMGAEPVTFAGLSGVGDLITTCTSTLSRNFQVGRALAEGKSLQAIQEEMYMVAEGVPTVKAVHDYAEKQSISMPITEAVYRVLYENENVQEAIHGLMTRESKEEKFPELPL